MPLFPRLRDRIAAHRRSARPIAEKLASPGYTIEDLDAFGDMDDRFHHGGTPAPIEEFEEPLAPPRRRRRPIRDYLTGLAIKAALNKLKGLPPMLSGYKTYITAAVIVAVAALESFGGVDIPGFDMGLSDAIVMAAGLVFARIGATTEAKKVG